MRIKALFSLAALGYAGLALAQAQTTIVEEKKTETVTVVVKEAPKPPDFVFELHGFVSTTMWMQDAGFGLNNNNPANGQAALNVLKTFTEDKPLFGADIRQTRLNFSVRGPQVIGATPKAVVEIDFFGGDSPGGFGDVSVWPRLRIAYLELAWDGGKQVIQIGQQNQLTIGYIPQTLRGIAFPMTYTAGTVGWRQPGIWGFHTFGDQTKFEFAWSIQRSGWANNAQVNFYNAGVSSGLPAFEARGKLMFGKSLDLWISGHWQQADRNGPDFIATTNPTSSTVTTALGTVGLKTALGPFALAGSAWYGKNAGPLLGNVLPLSTAVNGCDIFGWGAWGQLGFNVTNNLSLWYTYGIDHPTYENIFQANLPVLRNNNQIGMVRYQVGALAFGFEWLYSRTTYNHQANISTIQVGSSSGSVAVPVVGAPIITTNTDAQLAQNNVLTGSQFSLSANYYF